MMTTKKPTSDTAESEETTPSAVVKNALSLSEVSPARETESNVQLATHAPSQEPIRENADADTHNHCSNDAQPEKAAEKTQVKSANRRPQVTFPNEINDCTTTREEQSGIIDEIVEVAPIIDTSTIAKKSKNNNNNISNNNKDGDNNNLLHSPSTSGTSTSSTHSFAGRTLNEVLNELSQSGKRSSSSILTDTSITWVKVLNVTSFSTVSLNITWGVCLIGALSCFLLSEVYQGLYPVYPLSFVITLGCYLNVLSAIVVYFLGRKEYGGQYYHLYQPFVGGERFVCLQCVGVLALLFVIIGASAQLKVFDASHVVHGVMALLGAAGVGGNTLLWLSLRYFNVPYVTLPTSTFAQRSHNSNNNNNNSSSNSGRSKTSKREYDARHVRRQLHLCESSNRHSANRLSTHPLLSERYHRHNNEENFSLEKLLVLLCKPPNRELAIVVCMMTGQFILSNIATLVQHGVPHYVAIINTLVQIFNWVIVHCHIGCKHIPGYSMFMFSLQRRLDTCLYWLLQIIYLISILFNFALLYEGDVTTPLAMMVIAALNLFSCGVYILFIRTTSFKASRTPSYSSMSEYGSIAVVVSAVLAGLFNLCVEYIMQYWPSTELEFAIGTSSWSTHELLGLCLISSEVFLLTLSPFTDRLGRVIHGDAFSLLSPHFGSLASNVIQAVGWLLYVLAMLSFTLYLSARDVRLCTLSSIGAVLSVMCMVFAIRAYDKASKPFSPASFAQTIATNLNKEGVTTNPSLFSPSLSPSSPSPSPSPAGSPDHYTQLFSPTRLNEEGNVVDLPVDQLTSFCGPAHLTFVLNNEMMLSYLVALASVMLNFVVDISLQHIWGVVEVPVERIMFVSDLLFMIGVPLAHYSARDKMVHVWRPFSGSGHFVALQVLGWTIYAFHLIFAIVTNIFVQSGTISLRETLHFFAQYRLYCSMFGLLRLTPIILITLSIAVETLRAVKCAELRILAQDAFECMRQVAMQSITTPSMPTDTTEKTKTKATTHHATSPNNNNNNNNNNNDDNNSNNQSDSNDASIKAAMMELAFRTITEPMLQYYEIPYTDNTFTLQPILTSPEQQQQQQQQTTRVANQDWLRNSTGKMIVTDDNMHTNETNRNKSVHSPLDNTTCHKNAEQEIDAINAEINSKHESVNINANKSVNEHDKKDNDNIGNNLNKKIGTTLLTNNSLSTHSFVKNKSMLVTPEEQNRHESMRIIVILLCCASATFYLLAAFLYKLPMFSFAFVICASLVCTASCIGIHAGYGNIVHGSSGEFGVFMPFKGGRKYLKWQIIGWWCYALTFLVTLQAAIESERLAPPILVIAALLSVVSQVCIFNSIELFVIHHDKLSFFEENGEGVVALCGVVGSFAVSYAYNLIDRFVDRSDGFSFHSLVGKRARNQLHVPFVVSMLSISLTAPCILIALGRTTRQWRHVAKKAARAEAEAEAEAEIATKENTTLKDNDNNNDNDNKNSNDNNNNNKDMIDHAVKPTTVQTESEAKLTNKDSRETNLPVESQKPSVEITSHLSTVWATAIMNMLEVLVIMMSTFLPLTIAFVAYNFTQSYTPHLFHFIENALPLLCGMVVLTLLLSVVPYIVSVGVPEFAIRLRIAVVTHCLFSLALITASAVLVPMFIWPRVCTVYGTCCIVFITIVGSYEKVRVTLWFGAYVCIGYCFYQLYASCMYPQIHFPAIRTVMRCLYDVLTLSIWIWYIPQYRGKPYYTGALRNLRFIRFARKYIYADMAKYFTFRVIVDDPSTLNLRDGKHQYLFSIHPHGVFASTALYGIHTEEWERQLGSAPNQYISLHEATIVFNIPVVRDFNMAMGALLVSRPCIEASIQRGNSVLIVTGGQAEMLFTKSSNTELTLITRHTGFIRIAIANRIPLVPFIALGENNVLGLLELPSIQRIALRFLGFPFPVIPYGRWFLPLPFPAHVALLVGKPIPIPEGASENNQEDVEALSKLYFSELRKLFYRRRADGGYPEMELYLTDGKSNHIKPKETSS